MSWLVLAGEASGDRIAASTVRALEDRARPWGVGGPACERAGVERIVDVDLGAMGVGDVLVRAPALARAVIAIAGRARAEPPRAALLTNFTELSARLGPFLRRRGTRVLWCVAPQIWAWRPGRATRLAGAMDRLAVILPFEVALWRRAGVDATYVGHPALELARASTRSAARAALGIDARALAVGVLPGSRAGEIARLAPALASAAAILRARHRLGAAIVIEAPGLPQTARRALADAARQHDLALVRADPDAGAAALLPAFDVTLCASGTASLEAALAGAPPVVAYRLDRLAYAVARRLVTTEHVALPNVLLGRRAYPEVLQGDVTAERLAREAEAWLDRPADARALADELAAGLAPPDGAHGSFGERVAALLRDWLPALDER